MTYRRDFRDFSREVYWTAPRVALWFVLGSIMIAGISLLSLPFGIVSKVADPNNVLTNYSRFHDLNTAYKSRVAQLAAHRAITPVDNAEASRLRIETAAVAQSCREIVARYNADAEKIHVSIFKGQSLPEKLSMDACN